MRQTPTENRTSRAGVARWELLGLIGVLAVGATLRLAYLRERADQPDFRAPAADAMFHDYWARGLVTGNWTPPAGMPDPQIQRAPYLRPPGYPYFLAAVYGIAGPSPWAAAVAQMIVGLGSCVLGWILGRWGFGPAAGLAAAALLATHWAFLYYEEELQEPFLLVFLMLAALAALQRWTVSRRAGWAAMAGVVLGAFAVTRPNGLLLILAALAWIGHLCRRSPQNAVRPLLALGSGAAALIAPVTIRNFVVARDFVLISSNGGINLYVGNNPRADGVKSDVPELQALAGRSTWGWFSYPQIARALEHELGRPLKPSQVEAYFGRRAMQFIRQNPGQFLRLTGRRALLFWGPAVVSNNKEIHYDRQNSPLLRYLPGFPLLFTLALLLLLTLPAGRRHRAASPRDQQRSDPARRTMALLWLFAGTYFASFLPFLVAERFRVPVSAVLCVLAGAGVAHVLRAVNARRWRAVGAWTVAGAAAYGLASVPWVAYRPDKALWHAGRAAAFRRQGDVDSAIAELRAALLVAPEFSEARAEIARLLDERGQTDEALREYAIAVKSGRLSAAMYYNYAAALHRAGRLADAAAAYRQAVELAPRWPEAHVNLGAALDDLGRPDEALEHYRRALELNPQQVEALYNAALNLLARGQTTQAVGLLEKAVQIKPDYAPARQKLQALRP